LEGHQKLPGRDWKMGVSSLLRVIATLLMLSGKPFRMTFKLSRGLRQHHQEAWNREKTKEMGLVSCYRKLH
jgi:hypothetical protein